MARNPAKWTRHTAAVGSELRVRDSTGPRPGRRHPWRGSARMKMSQERSSSGDAAVTKNRERERNG